jgi:hypothetical protein
MRMREPIFKDCVCFDPDFVSELSKHPVLIICWRFNMPDGTSLPTIILSNDDYIGAGAAVSNATSSGAWQPPIPLDE